MAIWWITAIGFVLCIGFVGGTIVYGLKGTLKTSDSTTIDPKPKEEELTK